MGGEITYPPKWELKTALTTTAISGWLGSPLEQRSFSPAPSIQLLKPKKSLKLHGYPSTQSEWEREPLGRLIM